MKYFISNNFPNLKWTIWERGYILDSWIYGMNIFGWGVRTDIVPLRPGLYFHIQDLPPGGLAEMEDKTNIILFFSPKEIHIFPRWTNKQYLLIVFPYTGFTSRGDWQRGRVENIFQPSTILSTKTKTEIKMSLNGLIYRNIQWMDIGQIVFPYTRFTSRGAGWEGW